MYSLLQKFSKRRMDTKLVTWLVSLHSNPLIHLISYILVNDGLSSSLNVVMYGILGARSRCKRDRLVIRT